MSFANLYLGVFVVSLSIMILRPLLGIGSAVAHSRGSRRSGYSDKGRSGSNSNKDGGSKDD